MFKAMGMSLVSDQRNTRPVSIESERGVIDRVGNDCLVLASKVLTFQCFLGWLSAY